MAIAARRRARLPQIQAWWRDRLPPIWWRSPIHWAWVDANGGQARSGDKTHDSGAHADLPGQPGESGTAATRGYFEELLDLYGVATKTSWVMEGVAGLGCRRRCLSFRIPAGCLGWPDGSCRHLHRLQTQVLAAFFALRFVSARGR